MPMDTFLWEAQKYLGLEAVQLAQSLSSHVGSWFRGLEGEGELNVLNSSEDWRGLLLICKKKDKKWAIFCTLPVLRLSACESVNHMGISNFFLLGIAVIRRDVERTLKSHSLKAKECEK